MSLELLEVISHDDFIEKCIDCMCELQGEVFHHDTLYQRMYSDKGDIMNRKFYNYKNDEFNLIYRYLSESNSYEIYYND